MRVLVVYAHPVDGSFVGTLHRTAVETLREAGHHVDDCDLYAEGFDPVMRRDERLGYHDHPDNETPVREHVERLRRAEALVFCFPVWMFGPPAMLKGYFDRVFLPGVTFGIRDDGGVEGLLTGVRKVAAVVTYGADRKRAWLAGDPPRRLLCRTIARCAGSRVPTRYLARYGINTMTEARGRKFIERVRREMAAF